MRPDIDLKIEETTGLVRRGGGWLKVGLCDLAEIDDQFPEIPGTLLRKEAWSPEAVGTWKRPDNIVRLEARALIIALQRVCRDIGGSSIR